MNTRKRKNEENNDTASSAAVATTAASRKEEESEVSPYELPTNKKDTTAIATAAATTASASTTTGALSNEDFKETKTPEATAAAALYAKLPTDIQKGSEASVKYRLPILKALWAYKSMEKHSESKFYENPPTPEPMKKGGTTWNYYWKADCKDKTCNAHIYTKSNLKSADPNHYTARKNHDVEWPVDMTVSSINLIHTCKTKVHIAEYEFSKNYPGVCIKCCIQSTTTSALRTSVLSCDHCKAPWCLGDLNNKTERFSICLQCYQRQDVKRHTITRLMKSMNDLFYNSRTFNGDSAKWQFDGASAIWRMSQDDTGGVLAKDSAPKFIKSIDSLVAGKEREEDYIDKEGAVDIPVPRHKYTVSQFLNKNYYDSLKDGRDFKKGNHNGIDALGDKNSGEMLEDCIPYDEYLTSLTDETRRIMLNSPESKVRIPIIGASMKELTHTNQKANPEHHEWVMKGNALMKTETNNMDILKKIIEDPFAQNKLASSLNGASLHIQRDPKSDYCKEWGFKGDQNINELTAYYFHVDKFGGFVMFHQLYGFNWTFISVPAPDPKTKDAKKKDKKKKESWFDTTQNDGNMWKEYSNWKDGIPKDDRKKVDEFEKHIKKYINDHHPSHPRISVFLVGAGQRLCFAAGELPHGGLVVPRRLQPKEYTESHPEIDGIGRALMVSHDLKTRKIYKEQKKPARRQRGGNRRN